MASSTIVVFIDAAHARLLDVATAGRGAPHIIASDAERMVKSTGHAPNLPPHGFGGAGTANLKHLEQRREHDLHAYYAQVAQVLRPADQLIIFGHEEARRHLEAALRHEAPSVRIRATEGADRMTDIEMQTRAREIMGQPAPRLGPR